MPLELTEDYRLRWNDFDRYGRIAPDSVLDICQSLAITHAEHIGIGRARLLENDLVWVLVRVKFEIMRTPAREVLQVRTWPHSPSSVAFLRDFIFSDAQGPAIKATSEWVLMNTQTRKFARFDESMLTSTDYASERAFESKPKKIAPLALDSVARPLLTCVPNYNDIDINGHVNNARYPVYVMNALTLAPDQQLHSLQIDYRHEIAPQTTIAIYAHESTSAAPEATPPSITASGVLEDGTVAFNCLIELTA